MWSQEIRISLILVWVLAVLVNVVIADSLNYELLNNGENRSDPSYCA